MQKRGDLLAVSNVAQPDRAGANFPTSKLCDFFCGICPLPGLKPGESAGGADPGERANLRAAVFDVQSVIYGELTHFNSALERAKDFLFSGRGLGKCMRDRDPS